MCIFLFSAHPRARTACRRPRPFAFTLYISQYISKQPCPCTFKAIFTPHTKLIISKHVPNARPLQVNMTLNPHAVPLTPPLTHSQDLFATYKPEASKTPLGQYWHSGKLRCALCGKGDNYGDHTPATCRTGPRVITPDSAAVLAAKALAEWTAHYGSVAYVGDVKMSGADPASG